MATASIIAGLGTALSVASTVTSALDLDDTLLSGVKGVAKSTVQTGFDEIAHFIQAPSSAYNEISSRLTDPNYKPEKNNPYHVFNYSKK